MKVELRTIYAGPAGNFAPGIVEMPDAEAKRQVEAGNATPVLEDVKLPKGAGTREFFEGQTVPVLTLMAAEAGLDLGKRPKKAELVEALLVLDEEEAKMDEESDGFSDPDRETAEAPGGENAAETTGRSEPRQRTRPAEADAETDKENEGEVPDGS